MVQRTDAMLASHYNLTKLFWLLSYLFFSNLISTSVVFPYKPHHAFCDLSKPYIYLFPSFFFSRNTVFEEQDTDQTTAFLHLGYSANNVLWEREICEELK